MRDTQQWVYLGEAPEDSVGPPLSGRDTRNGGPMYPWTTAHSFWRGADATVTGRVGAWPKVFLTESLPVAVTIRADVSSASGHYGAGLWSGTGRRRFA